MNAPEGVRRIATSIRWIGDGLELLGVLMGIGAFIEYAVNDFRGDGLVSSGIFLVLAAILCGGRRVSWIVNGIAEPKAPAKV